MNNNDGLLQKQIEQLALAACKEQPDIMSFVTSTIKGVALAQLKQQILSCSKCPMSNHAHSAIYGNGQSGLLIINDCASKNMPLDEQSNSVYPFSEKEFKIMQVIFAAFKQDIQQSTIISSVNCATYDEASGSYRTPSTKEVSNCSCYVKRAIDILRPKMIVLLGNVALNTFFSSPISKVHGQQLNIFSVPTIPIFHPAYISSLKDELIKDKKKEEMMIDWRNAFQLLVNLE